MWVAELSVNLAKLAENASEEELAKGTVAFDIKVAEHETCRVIHALYLKRHRT